MEAGGAREREQRCRESTTEAPVSFVDCCRMSSFLGTCARHSARVPAEAAFGRAREMA